MGSDRFLPHLSCVQYNYTVTGWDNLMMFLYWGIWAEAAECAPKHVTSCQRASLLTTNDSHLSGSRQLQCFPASRLLGLLKCHSARPHWSVHRHPTFLLENQEVFVHGVNQFMQSPIPHILIHESQVKYSQKHICPCVDIYSRPLNGNGWPILGNKIRRAIFPSAWPSVVSPPTWIIVPVSPDAANWPAYPQWSGCDGITESITRDWSLTCFCCRRGRASHGRTQRWTRGSFCKPEHCSLWNVKEMCHVTVYQNINNKRGLSCG